MADLLRDLRDAAISNLPPTLYIPALIAVACVAWPIEWLRRACNRSER